MNTRPQNENKKDNLYGLFGGVGMGGKMIIRSINDDQQQIIKDIMTLNNIPFIDFDPTYSKGIFYKNWCDPEVKGDINPIDDSLSLIHI